MAPGFWRMLARQSRESTKMRLRPDQMLRFRDKAGLLREVADLIVRTLARMPAPSFNITGGGTAAELYRLIAAEYAAEIDWPSLTITWGDERFVPRGDPAHNATMARRELFDRVPVGELRVHEIPTDRGTPEACAAAYEATLQQIVRPGKPLFDLTLLSLGDDGHIASLLPGQPVLNEHDAWVAAVPQGREEQRITLTYPALRLSGRLLLIVSGEKKAKVLHDLLRGAEDYPASRLAIDGELLLLADAAALPE